MEREELRIRKIKHGTVIDHIAAGHALSVLKILNITGREGYIVSIAMNVPSKKLGRKDIVKVEGRELKEEEVNKIALIAPTATINIIKDYKVIKKNRITLPDKVEGIIRCRNPVCITNSPREPVTPKFKVISRKPIRLRCEYCETILEAEDIVRQF
ncbi:MAG: aspartate carbamoyltransferase regulatory subunit [Candidatus Methanomethylicota archaeon]|uniref:Aspartate carbamoyltransferase regulatory chain n=1 Tax=Thermoproteota archaeon TaxID=2056631 RepID=A0A497EVV8_9CREN|nr:MAG: aspartate carbamoyltransferase regulatory subunit [Candidatus Verstraetearchaeota archaeon]RLE55530.1 MAG: aspartate carbamoyltransferase regulatory subunit [Candidatus Verstraetearchaeota archaeon]